LTKIGIGLCYLHCVDHHTRSIDRKDKRIIMKKNMGGMDRVVRLLIALAVIALYYFGVISGTLATIALILAAIFAITSLVSFCPLYTLFGINTCKVKN
jgi:hypothetical protein